MNTAIEQLRSILGHGSGNNVVLDEIDNKLNDTFWSIYEKSSWRKRNFDTLKRLTMNLQRFKYQVVAIGVQYNMEYDLKTLTNALKEAIEARDFQTPEEKRFLKALWHYRDGVQEVERYQDGVRRFLNLARQAYDKFYNSRCGVDQSIYTFDRFLSRFSSLRLTYVASHGIIGINNQLSFTNLGLLHQE